MSLHTVPAGNDGERRQERLTADHPRLLAAIEQYRGLFGATLSDKEADNLLQNAVASANAGLAAKEIQSVDAAAEEAVRQIAKNVLGDGDTDFA